MVKDNGPSHLINWKLCQEACQAFDGCEYWVFGPYCIFEGKNSKEIQNEFTFTTAGLKHCPGDESLFMIIRFYYKLANP